MRVEEGGTDRDADGCASMRWGRLLALVYPGRRAAALIRPVVGHSLRELSEGCGHTWDRPARRILERLPEAAHAGRCCCTVALQRPRLGRAPLPLWRDVRILPKLVRGESGDRPTVGNQRRMSIAFPHMPAARQPPPAHGEISNEQGRLAQAPPKAPRWSVTALGRIVWDPVGIPAAAMQARAPSCASAPSWAGACPMAVDARRLVTCDLNVWINGSAVLLVLVESPAFTLHHKS